MDNIAFPMSIKCSKALVSCSVYDADLASGQNRTGREPLHDLCDLRRENRSLRDRFARLGGTVLRMNSSLDLDTVLQELVDSACALTGASQGVITTIDWRGRLVDFLTSGVSAEEVRELEAWPDGPQLSEHVRDIEQPCQLADLSGYLESRAALLRPLVHTNAAVRSDAPSRPAPRPLLRRRQGGRRAVHTRGRGDHGALRRPSGRRDRERMHAPRCRGGRGPT